MPEPLRFPGAVGGEGSKRNVFAFVEAPPVPVAATPVRVAERRADEGVRPSSVVVDVVREPELGYRCIGTFGPANRRFAVFAAPGEIVNAEIGERIGKTAFVLREIGIETVTVETANVVKRLAIGS